MFSSPVGTRRELSPSAGPHGDYSWGLTSGTTVLTATILQATALPQAPLGGLCILTRSVLTVPTRLSPTRGCGTCICASPRLCPRGATKHMWRELSQHVLTARVPPTLRRPHCAVTALRLQNVLLFPNWDAALVKHSLPTPRPQPLSAPKGNRCRREAWPLCSPPPSPAPLPALSMGRGT